MKSPLAKELLLKLFLAAVLIGAATPIAGSDGGAPNLFSYPELSTLYSEQPLPGALAQKLQRLLSTPFVDNSISSGVTRPFPASPKLGQFLRVAHWNIERGIEFDAIAAMFESEEKFSAVLNAEEFPVGSKERSEILEEAAMLRQADIIVFNEVDWGLKRTGYRHIAAEIARKLNMNFAFGVQFVELSPVHLSSRPIEEGADSELARLIRVEPDRYKGLHGVAILSKFPLENVRLIPFQKQKYDWFGKEKAELSLLEKGKRFGTRKIFLERTLREVRRGGRTTLMADAVDSRLPSGRVTVVATHLENRTDSAGRLEQLKELLGHLKTIPNPVVLAGDMNTSGSDGTPTSIKREVIKRFGNPKFWAKKGASYLLGFGLFEDLLMSGMTLGRNHADPTVRHIPLIAPNREAKFFDVIEKFRFEDGGVFDFRGDRERSVGRKKKELSNSNQRGHKGFVTTFQVDRPILFLGKYKLDWIFVKPPGLRRPNDSNGSYKFAPHFGRTLTRINEAVEGHLSDHRPMIIDLPIAEPPLEKSTQ